MHQSERQQRIEALTAQLVDILHDLARLQPPDIVALVLALPVDLAGYMSEVARERSARLPDVYVSFALHGALHGALEHGLDGDVRRLLAMIRRLAPEEEWAQFRALHPEVEDVPFAQGDDFDG